MLGQYAQQKAIPDNILKTVKWTEKKLGRQQRIKK